MCLEHWQNPKFFKGKLLEQKPPDLGRSIFLDSSAEMFHTVFEAAHSSSTNILQTIL